jgi:hypothetical protein
MSLHAQLSPEALERLHKQRRNSTISSIVIAFLSITLVALVLGVFLLPSLVKEVPTIVTYESNLDNDNELVEKKVQVSTNRKPSSPSSSMSKVIVSNTSSPTSVPVPDVDVTNPSLDFGDGDDFGSGWGDGDGTGGGFGNIPATMKKRCSKEDRLARLQETGGTPECEEAVVKALRWLKKTQKSDGSWGNSNQAAMTGFALLAFLGHCETPHSEEFGDTVTRAILYLINVGLKNDGRIATSAPASNHWVYEHGIGTYALAEAYTFCSKLNINFPDLDKVTIQAGDMIIQGQGASGGWVYCFASTNSGDNSVGFWQIQALKACYHTGLWTDSKLKKSGRKALEWLEKAQGANGAIGYRGNSGQSPGLTGGGVLCFQMWDAGRSRNARSGVKYLSKNSDFNWGEENANLYYHYYNAQALINHGGVDWDVYNAKFRDELLKNQAKDGSWNQSGVKHGPVNNHMATCLATLMLEVYYRFLPGTGAGTK